MNCVILKKLWWIQLHIQTAVTHVMHKCFSIAVLRSTQGVIWMEVFSKLLCSYSANVFLEFKFAQFYDQWKQSWCQRTSIIA